MTEGYLGEIRILPINYTPQKWTPCYGQLMAIAGFEDVYSVVGTTYGGDGRTNFGVPDLRGRVPIHRGTGPGLTPRTQGEMFGTEEVTLTEDQLPNHNHDFQAVGGPANSEVPTDALFCQTTYGSYQPYNSSRLADFNDEFLQAAGGSGAHSNMMRFVVMKFFMCIKGVYPQHD